jgi:hypothetical protein
MKRCSYNDVLGGTYQGSAIFPSCLNIKNSVTTGKLIWRKKNPGQQSDREQFSANNGFKTGQPPAYLPSPCRYNFFPAELQVWL